MEIMESDLTISSLSPNDTPAEECCPQKPRSECHMTQGAESLSLQPPVLPAPGFNAAQTGLPLLPPSSAQPEERSVPQQLQTGGYMPLGGAPSSLQQQVVPSSGLAPPMYQPPTFFQPIYYCMGAPFSPGQVYWPPVSLPLGLRTNRAGGFINGEMPLRNNTALPVADVPELNHKASQTKITYRKPHDESKPYVKKSPNAFAIFCTEQRPNVVKELQIKECEAITIIIRQRWKSLSDEEKAKYYKRAEMERQIHSHCFPAWSSRNYSTKTEEGSGYD